MKQLFSWKHLVPLIINFEENNWIRPQICYQFDIVNFVKYLMHDSENGVSHIALRRKIDRFTKKIIVIVIYMTKETIMNLKRTFQMQGYGLSIYDMK